MNDPFLASHSCTVGLGLSFTEAKIEEKAVGEDANSSKKAQMLVSKK